MSYQQHPSCSITESDLTEALLPDYLASLRWTSEHDPQLTHNKRLVKHGQAIGGRAFSAVISTDCNNILVQYGRRVVIRQASGVQLRLECHHHTHARNTKPEVAALSDQAANAKNAQVLADILVDKAKKQAAKNKKKKAPKVTKDANAPAPKQTRKSVSKQTGCSYALKFVCDLTDPQNPNCSRIWRLKTDDNSKTASVSDRQNATGSDDERVNAAENVPCNDDDDGMMFGGHTCSPDLALQVGGVLYLWQFTEPMMEFLRELASVQMRPSELRLRLQKKFDKDFIDFGLVQTALEKLSPSRGQEQRAEVYDLLDHLEANKTKFSSRCQYLPTVINGKRVRELRNVFFATKQMIRLFKEYGQLVIIDATYNITNFTMKLLVFTIRTAAGTFNIAAVALITEESEDDIRWAMLELMQQAGLTPGDVNGMVKCVMTDGARAYPAVIKDLMSSAEHQLCAWHQTENMYTFAKKWAKDGAIAAELMMNIVHETEPLTAEQKWFAMMDTQFNNSPRLQDELACNDETAAMKLQREMANNERHNARALLQVWYVKRRKFWKASTKHFMNIGTMSSQGGEVMNHAMKPTPKALTLSELIKMTERVSNRHALKQLKAIDRARNTKKLQQNVDDWTDILQSKLSIFAAELLTEQMALSRKNDYQPVNGIDGAITNSRNALGVDLAKKTCLCGFTKQYGLLCRHIMSLLDEEMKQSTEKNESARRESIAQACLSHAHARWHHEALFRVFELENPGAVSQRSSTSAIELVNEANEVTDTEHHIESDSESNDEPSSEGTVSASIARRTSSYIETMPQAPVPHTKVSIDIEFAEYWDAITAFRSRGTDAKLAMNEALRDMLYAVEDRVIVVSQRERIERQRMQTTHHDENSQSAPVCVMPLNHRVADMESYSSDDSAVPDHDDLPLVDPRHRRAMRSASSKATSARRGQKRKLEQSQLQ